MISIWVVGSAVGGILGGGCVGGFLGGGFLLGGGGGLGFSLLLYCCSKDCSGFSGCCINVRVVEVLRLRLFEGGVEGDSVGEGDHAGDGEEEGCSHHFVDFLC